MKAAAESFRENPEFDTLEAIGSLGIGEALVSFLDSEGRPGIVEKSKILPPKSMMGPIDDTIRKQQIEQNMLFIRYGEMVDRESAYELLGKRVAQEEEAEQKEKELAQQEKEAERLKKQQEKEAQKLKQQQEKAAEREAKKTKTAVKNVAKTATGTIGREIGNSIGKSVGGTFGKKLGGNLGAALGRGILDTLFKL